MARRGRRQYVVGLKDIDGQRHVWRVIRWFAAIYGSPLT